MRADQVSNDERVVAVRAAFARIVSAESAVELDELGRRPMNGSTAPAIVPRRFIDDVRRLATGVHRLVGEDGMPTPVDVVADDLDSGLTFALQLARDPAPGDLPPLNREYWLAILAWLTMRGLGGLSSVPDRSRRCRQRMLDWGLDEVVAGAFAGIGRTDAEAGRGAVAIAAITALPMWSPDRATADASAVLASWLADAGAQRALGVHRDRGGMERFDLVAYEALAAWTTWVAAVRLAEYRQAYRNAGEPMLAWVTSIHQELLRVGVAAGERVDVLHPTGRID